MCSAHAHNEFSAHFTIVEQYNWVVGDSVYLYCCCSLLALAFIRRFACYYCHKIYFMSFSAAACDVDIFHQYTLLPFPTRLIAQLMNFVNSTIILGSLHTNIIVCKHFNMTIELKVLSIFNLTQKLQVYKLKNISKFKPQQTLRLQDTYQH